MAFLLAAGIFVGILLIFAIGYTLVRGEPRQRSLHQAVQRYTASAVGDADIDIIYYRKFSEIRFFHTLLAGISVIRNLDELMQQARVNMLAGVFLLMTLTAGALAGLLGLAVVKSPLLALVLAAVALYLPFLFLLVRRQQQRKKFETLFPDALDLMAYSLKAGHSILASFKMVAEEMGPPVGEEFGRVVEEINFGNNIETTLHNFARRVDSTELRFFVTSVIIQRETGGNLVEILDKIAETIRKKFRFQERVKALAAEGKVSAYVLVALPFLLALAFTFLNRKYIMVLFTDPIGLYILLPTGVMMGIGILILLKMVQLDA